MLFVIDKPEFQHAISIVRDDRTKRNQGQAGPFMRLEAQDDYVKLTGLAASAKIPATVYEPGVLFLKITVLRRLLQTIKGEKFVTIQVMADELLLDRVRLPLESNEMLLYPNADQAPDQHPSLSLIEPERVSISNERQLNLWDETEIDKKRGGNNSDQ